MNITKLLYKCAVFILIAVSLSSFSACSPQKKPDLKKAQEEAEAKKPPEELDKLKESISKVEKALESIHEESRKPIFIQQERIEKQSSEEGGKKQEEVDQSEGGSGGEGKSGSEGGGQQAQAPKLTPEQLAVKLQQEKYKRFESIKKDVMALHSAWNSYEAKAIADFAMQSAINDFETSLNNLTRTVEAQDDYQSLLEINQLYKYLPDFYMLYESKIPPDLDRIRFSIKKIKLLCEKKDFTGANDVLLYFENVWMAARPKLKTDNAEIVSKFEFALADLKNSVISKNDMIVEAKTEVLLKLVDEIEKKAEKAEK